VQYVVAIACSLVLFVALANGVVGLYVRGVARAAVDEAARAGAALDATTANCEQRADDVLDGVVAPHTVQVTCRDAGDAMRAQARVVLPGWLPGIPTWSMVLEGQVVKERLP
jgi:hypothetical protein